MTYKNITDFDTFSTLVCEVNQRVTIYNALFDDKKLTTKKCLCAVSYRDRPYCFCLKTAIRLYPCSTEDTALIKNLFLIMEAKCDVIRSELCGLALWVDFEQVDILAKLERIFTEINLLLCYCMDYPYDSLYAMTNIKKFLEYNPAYASAISEIKHKL
jgi:hypothetical protein